MRCTFRAGPSPPAGTAPASRYADLRLSRGRGVCGNAAPVSGGETVAPLSAQVGTAGAGLVLRWISDRSREVARFGQTYRAILRGRSGAGGLASVGAERRRDLATRTGVGATGVRRGRQAPPFGRTYPGDAVSSFRNLPVREGTDHNFARAAHPERHAPDGINYRRRLTALCRWRWRSGRLGRLTKGTRRRCTSRS
jgi:hypothetical protein